MRSVERFVLSWMFVLLVSASGRGQRSGCEFSITWPEGTEGVSALVELALPEGQSFDSPVLLAKEGEDLIPRAASFQALDDTGRRFLLSLDARDGRLRYRIVNATGSRGKLAAPLTIDRSRAGRLGVRSATGSELLRYVSGMTLADGQPEDRRRSTYVYPVFDPRGVNVLDDFPKDHPHHRGISWMWPQVSVEGKAFDLWHIRGIRQRFEALKEESSGPLRATLRIQSGWYQDERRVVDERLHLAASPAFVGGQRVGHLLDFEFRWEAVKDPVTLGGQKNGGKGYGGFGLRLAPRRNAKITTSLGVVPKDSLHQRPSWADYSARFRGATEVSGIAILPHPRNEGYPSEWILRRYGYIGECWPGLRGLTLKKGKPIEARYRVYLHLGSAEEARVADFQKLWAADLRAEVKAVKR